MRRMVQRGIEIGARGESRAALQAQINAGVGGARSLEQRKARAALAAARREQIMETMSAGITIHDHLDFAQLKLSRDANGTVSFDWPPERICTANGVDPTLSAMRPRTSPRSS